MKIHSLCGHLSSNNLLFAETVLNFHESCGKQLDVEYDQSASDLACSCVGAQIFIFCCDITTL